MSNIKVEGEHMVMQSIDDRLLLAQTDSETKQKDGISKARNNININPKKKNNVLPKKTLVNLEETNI